VQTENRKPGTGNRSTGDSGEKTAAEYLRSKGYTILETNYKGDRCELDIIAREGDIIVFVEVKTRSGTTHGFPEEAVGAVKQENIGRAAETYLINHRLENEIRFDVISIVTSKNKAPEIYHIPDAFIPGEADI
jgi:putative endonuclease